MMNGEPNDNGFVVIASVSLPSLRALDTSGIEVAYCRIERTTSSQNRRRRNMNGFKTWEKA